MSTSLTSTGGTKRHIDTVPEKDTNKKHKEISINEKIYDQRDTTGDLIIKLEGGELFKCHSVFLIASSNYFKDLDYTPKKSEEIDELSKATIKEIDLSKFCGKTIKNMISAVYLQTFVSEEKCKLLEYFNYFGFLELFTKLEKEISLSCTNNISFASGPIAENLIYQCYNRTICSSGNNNIIDYMSHIYNVALCAIYNTYLNMHKKGQTCYDDIPVDEKYKKASSKKHCCLHNINVTCDTYRFIHTKNENNKFCCSHKTKTPESVKLYEKEKRKEFLLRAEKYPKQFLIDLLKLSISFD